MWEIENQQDEDYLEEIMEEPSYVERERVEIIEEKMNVETLEPIEEEFVAVSPINIPSSPCVPLVSSSMLEGDPYTYEDDNEEDKGYKHAYAADSDDDRSVPKFSEKETDAFVKVWGRDPNVHEFKDVRQAHLAVADSNLREYGPERPRPLTEDEAQSRPRARPLIYPGLKFKAMLDMQVWFQEYAVSHHRPYIVFKSDQNERYVLICENEDCPWKVWARKKKPEGWWKISKYEGPHTCGNVVLEGNKHRQLTSTFIAHRCANAIKATPTLQAASLVQFVKLIFDYHIKYGKA